MGRRSWPWRRNSSKTKGYNLTHPCGHGENPLSALWVTLNRLAFLLHTVLDLCDRRYQVLREALPSRRTFFNDIRALTRYLCFDSLRALFDFMLRGLEIERPDSS